MHCTFGHIGMVGFKQLYKENLFHGLDFKNLNNLPFYTSCLQRNYTQPSSQSKETQEWKPMMTKDSTRNGSFVNILTFS